MKTSRRAVMAGLASGVLASCNIGSRPRLSAVTAINGVTVIDPETGARLERQRISLRADRIASIGPAAAHGTDTGLGVIDGTGLYAIPGMIDAHVHALGIYSTSDPGITDLGWINRQQTRNLEMFVRGGITTVRDLGSALNMIEGFSRRAREGEILTPRIDFAGCIFTVAGGYPYFVPPSSGPMLAITGPIRCDLDPGLTDAELERTIARVRDHGARFVKIGYQSRMYDDARTPIPVMPLPLVQRVIATAHRLQMSVAVHHVYLDDLRSLFRLQGGKFESLEHITMDAELTDKDVRLFATLGIPISTTMTSYGMIDHLDRMDAMLAAEPDRFEARPLETVRGAIANMRAGRADPSDVLGLRMVKTGSTIMRANIARLRSAGVPVAFSTDAGGGIVPTGKPQWEMSDMARAGMTPLEILRSATSHAADVLRRPELGRLQASKAADIVLLAADPTESIDAVASVEKVVIGGKLAYERPRTT